MNKRLLIITFLTLLLISVKINMSYYDDYQTSLLPGVYIQENQTDLISNRWSVPLVTDWNNDGNKDLIIGNRIHGKGNDSKGYISFYQNIGLDSRPMFDGFHYVKTCSDICSDLVVTPDG
jgi:hypothetical protein